MPLLARKVVVSAVNADIGKYNVERTFRGKMFRQNSSRTHFHIDCVFTEYGAGVYALLQDDVIFILCSGSTGDFDRLRERKSHTAH